MQENQGDDVAVRMVTVKVAMNCPKCGHGMKSADHNPQTGRYYCPCCGFDLGISPPQCAMGKSEFRKPEAFKLAQLVWSAAS